MRHLKCTRLVGLSKVIGLCFWAVIFVGCASTRQISESYTMPAEINMADRKSIVLEKVRGQSQASDALTSRLRQSLLSKGFVVLDRESMDAKAREAFFGDDQNSDIVSATVLIRGNVLHSVVNTETERRISTTKEGRQYYVYQTTGRGRVEVSYDVVDLGTTKVITSATIESFSQQRSGWSEGGAPRIDTSPILNACYDDNVAQLMRKLAPYQVRANHTLYQIKEAPRSQSGISLLLANRPNDAYNEFKAALEMMQDLPNVRPALLGRLTHNMAVATELAGFYEEALDLYIQASLFAGVPDNSANITRCQLRARDITRLREQGIH
ncbi:MAG TPA: hypothetical protein PKE55_08205 [Kiritimatiellia bacterium]|nr:hypothetical protein [Kiritimatiellia bacterium]